MHNLNTHWWHSFVVQLSPLNGTSKRRYTALTWLKIFCIVQTFTHTRKCMWHKLSSLKRCPTDWAFTRGEPTLPGQELYSTLGLASIKVALNHNWTGDKNQQLIRLKLSDTRTTECIVSLDRGQVIFSLHQPLFATINDWMHDSE